MNWTRGETLGKGAFGFVSIAKTHQQSRDNNTIHHLPPLLAIKSAKLSDSKSLFMEKELLHKFQACPNIIRCFGDDITTENGQKLYNILLEYASGGCLADRIVPKKGLPEKIVRRYTKSILNALVHIHTLGYVHCDVKPHNVLLVGDDEGDAKLADFGSCVKWSLRDDDNCSSDFRGTVIYAAPESIARQKYAPECDVWALGCTVLQMLTGKSPWVFDKKAKAKDVLLKIGWSSDVPEIPTTKNKISNEAKDFIKKCLVKDPTARWKSDMLLDHPFVKIEDVTAIAGKCSRHRHATSRLSHVLMPHCFHVGKVHAC